MKICYFSCSSIFGGIENIIVKSLNELSKTNEVALIVPKNCEYKNKLNNNVKIYEYQSFDKRYNPFLYLQIAKIAKNYELIHTHGAKATQIFYLLNKILNKKFVATKHNVRKGKIFNQIKNVIAVSKEVAKTIKNSPKIIYFGHEKQDIKPEILSDKFSIVSVGRLDKIKGFDLLINTLANVEFDFRLYIVGEGCERENLQLLIQKLNLTDRVFLLGFRNDTFNILKGANLQVIASRSEGFPNVLIEGIFYANALVSVNIGSIAEILDNKFLTTHENLSKKLDEIYKNYENYSLEFKEFAKKQENLLSLDRYICELKDYYKELR
ncbi:glycosyltransferase [Campylobacter majalis]|uniref:glycosyltransferase n=1 Tax=Campylobacter majalis TaxID=2790656 RepID=UPI003D698AC3